MEKISKIIFLILLGFVLSTYNVFGQEINKKKYTHDLDSIWSTNTTIRNISANANWIETSEFFSRKNIVRLFHPSTSNVIERENIKKSLFSNNEHFAILLSESKLEIIDLRNSKSFLVLNKPIRKVEFDTTNQQLAYLTTDDVLTLFDTKTENFVTKHNVSSFSWSPTSSTLAIISDNEKTVGLYSSRLEAIDQITSDTGTFIFNKYYPDNNWSNNGQYFSFLEKEDKNRKIFRYALQTKKVNIINMDNLLKINPSHYFFDESVRVLADGKFVEFQLNEKSTEDSLKGIEKWTTNDTWIYPKEKIMKEKDGYKRLIWTVDDYDSVTEIKGNQFALNSNIHFALTFDRKQYEPQYRYFEIADIYLNDYQSKKSYKIIDSLYTNPNFISVSPNGKYIAYFKNNNWNLYDVKRQIHKKLTTVLSQVFYDRTKADTDKPPFDEPYWSGDGKSILLTSTYDLWQFSIQKNEVKQITFGEKKDEHNRIARLNLSNPPYRNLKRSIDMNKPLIINLHKEDQSHGIAILKKGKVIHSFSTDAGISQIYSNKNKLYYRKEKYNESPSIHEFTTDHPTRLIYQSNYKLNEYDLGFSKNINYTSINGNVMNGVLLYPSQYDSTKTYPMVVNVYEKISKNVNDFVIPTLYSKDGFNILNYITKGYFVLLPDIEYEIGNPGYSALASVENAVKKAVEQSTIDQKRIGLIGFSFGGYESAFIASQSSLFKTAIAGSGVTDLISFYHDTSAMLLNDQMWRLENFQFRMGNSFYNLKDNYYKNSPLYHVENLKIPILLWTGKNDTNVNANQSSYLFMAMKRLGKEGELLLFDDEQHSLNKKQNQVFLSNSILNWFDTYLK
ncbi:prolyl oligopeptidase family serine peptidase [Empedobacter falsenii]